MNVSNFWCKLILALDEYLYAQNNNSFNFKSLRLFKNICNSF